MTHDFLRYINILTYLLTVCLWYKHHSTETAMLSIHDHLINATGSQKVSCLCLLDLFAAFDTIDHNILILSSWFGIVLSAGLSLTYHVAPVVLDDCGNNVSSLHTSFCGVPQGSE